ncbi:hypothetical protein [Paenibacillus sp.]|uniref:hypothetical protein n=1 Tax=Paenibacillus sp. TaxID=58172 RepID=UPI0028117D56|nr:hypothetical protein [Paenibacillus sp.]
MTKQEKAPRGDVRFQRPPAQLVAARADDKDIDAENKKLQADRPYPHSCGGL